MKGILVATLLAVFMLTGCFVPSRHRGGGTVLVPPLPPVVEFDQEPYYYQDGYHYEYRDNSWYYSNSRSGPWEPLPRDRYPRETRFKHRGEGRDRDQGRGHEGGHDRDRDHDGDRH